MADLGAIGFDAAMGYDEPLIVQLAEVLEPRPEATHVVGGTVRDDAGDPAARTVRVYRRTDGRLLGETTSDAVTGAYSVDVADVEVQCVILDDDTAPLYNDLILRVEPGAP